MRTPSPPTNNTNTNNTVNIENIKIITGTQAKVKPKLEAYLDSHPNAKIIGYAICSQIKKPNPQTPETRPEEPEEPTANPTPKGKKTAAASAGQDAAKQLEPLAAILSAVEHEHEIIHSYTLAYVF